MLSLHPPVLYVQIRWGWLSVRWIHPRQPAREYKDTALVAIRDNGSLKPEVVAVGSEAANLAGGQVRVDNAFDHPRVVIGDFDVALLTLREFVRRARRSSGIGKPRVVMHCLDPLGGGLTSVEARALVELAMRVGGGEVLLHCGPAELSDAEVLELKQSLM